MADEVLTLFPSSRRTETSMERVLGLNQSLVDSFARQQATPEPSSQSLGGPPPTHTPPSKHSAGGRAQSVFCISTVTSVSCATMQLVLRQDHQLYSSCLVSQRPLDVGRETSSQSNAMLRGHCVSLVDVRLGTIGAATPVVHNFRSQPLP